MSSVEEIPRKSTQEACRAISDQTLRNLAKSCKGLRTFQGSKGENRGDWLDHHESAYDVFGEVEELVENVVEDLADKHEISKSKTRKIVVEELRRRQEKLKITQYLINPTKYAIISNLLSWWDKVEDKPELRLAVQKPQKTRHSSRELGLIVKLDRRLKKGKVEVYECTFTNISRYPLQNLTITAYSSDLPVAIKSVKAELAEVNDEGKIVLPFVKASMKADRKYHFPLVFTVPLDRPSHDPIELGIAVDFTSENLTREATLSFS